MHEGTELRTNPGVIVLLWCQGSTFGIKGVEDHAHFLREVQHTSAIRSTLITNWNRANIPGRTRAERLRLLHTVVVGGEVQLFTSGSCHGGSVCVCM